MGCGAWREPIYKVQALSREDGGADSVWSKPSLKIQNLGDSLCQVRLRYCFTSETGKTPIAEDFSSDAALLSIVQDGDNAWSLWWDFETCLRPEGLEEYRFTVQAGLHDADWST